MYCIYICIYIYINHQSGINMINKQHYHTISEIKKVYLHATHNRHMMKYKDIESSKIRGYNKT